MFTPIGYYAAAGDTLYNYWNPADYTSNGTWACSKTGATWTAQSSNPVKDPSVRGVNIDTNSGAALKVFNMSTTQTGAEYINGNFGVINQTWELWTRQDVGVYTEWFGYGNTTQTTDNMQLRTGFLDDLGYNFGLTREYYANPTNVTGKDKFQSTTTGATGTWFHVAVTCGGTATDKKFYYNGVEFSPTDEDFQWNGGTMTALGSIGVGWNKVNTYNSKSTLGPFRIHSIELSSAEVLAQFNAEKTEFGL